MALTGSLGTFHHPGVSRIDYKPLDMDRVLTALLARLRDGVSGLAGSARGRGGGSLVELLQTPEQKQIMDRLTGLMSLLEGHADVTSGADAFAGYAFFARFDEMYVLDDPVERTQRYAPHGRYVSIAGAGHFSHEEAPEEVNGHLMRFLERVYRSPLS